LSTEPVQAFISYSHRDRRMRVALETHLALLRHQTRLTTWSDRLIGAGEAIDDAISDELLHARVVLLLVSADFIASDYCYGVELAAALAGHKAGTQRVIPIIVDHCDWKSAPFAKLKALPTDGKPIRAHRPQSLGWTDTVAGIRAAIDSLAPSPLPARHSPAVPAKRKAARPTGSQRSPARRSSTTSAQDWLVRVNIRQAWRNCRIDHYRDWYRDPWNWPEWEWLVKRDPGGSQDPQVREVLGVDETLDRLVERHAGRDEDREHHSEPSELLAAERSKEERDPERHRREGVTEVVDQVREKRDRARQQEDRHLRSGRERGHGEADRDGLDALVRADDRAVDEPMRAVVPVRVVLGADRL
jgi:hypothetical protein